MSFVEALMDFSAQLSRQYMRPPLKMVFDDRTYREIKDQLHALGKCENEGFVAGVTINTILGSVEIINEHQDKGEVAMK